MNSSSIQNSTPSLEAIDFNDFLGKDIPVVIYLVLLCLIGTFGNFHAVLIYSRRWCHSNHQIYIVVLAFVDFIACSVCIPFEIFDIRFSYTFTESSICKLFRFLNHFVSVGSGLLLALIAIERYRKVCTPFGRQIVTHEVRILCIIILVVDFLLSAPSFAFYGSAEKPTGYPNYFGRDCTDLKLPGSTYFFGGLLFLCTVTFILCIVLYCFIGKALVFHIQNVKNVLSTSNSCTEESGKSLTMQTYGSKHDTPTTERKGDNEIKQLKATDLGENEEEENKWKCKLRDGKPEEYRINTSPERKQSQNKRMDRTMQITLMLLVATVFSYLGYIPNIILIIIRTTNKYKFQELSNSLGEFISILMRGYFINNAINPIVYCFMDKRFRRDCKLFYKKTSHRVRECCK